MRDKTLLGALFFCFSTALIGQVQEDSLTDWKQKPDVKLMGYIDVFYIYDFNEPTTGFRQSFLYNYNRHNEFNLNLGFAKLSVEHQKYRANLALQAGTYPNDNYAAEPGLLKNIFESNIGISLNKKNKLWLDVGIIGSHIGFESAISFDNWNLTRSILAENSPYYFSGAKLTFNPTNKWELAALICNGWQRIKRISGNSLPSFGTQIKCKPSDKVTLNWSTFIGTDDPDTTRRMRYFNNLYAQIQYTNKFGLIAGFDIGAQQSAKLSSDYNLWLSPVLISQYSINKNWKTAIRAEFYQDETGIIIPTGTPNGFQTTGLSLNFDYSPIPNVICRLEGRWLSSKDAIFQTKTSPSSNNFILGTSIAVKFAE